jgi:hypothetical protein
MPTITTLIGVMVVFGLMIAVLIGLVTVLANLASRHDQSMRIDLDARRLRLRVSITPIQSRSVLRLPTPDEESHFSRPSEKTS